MDQVSELAEVFDNPIQRIQVDSGEFELFRSKYQDPRSGLNSGKFLEYFITYTYLDLKPDDVFMDVAAQDCPFAFFVRDTIGCRVYRQDLYYLNPGVNGEDIGGDAADMPLPDGALSKMALHNSFEHFEGDSDIRFIREAKRVLRPGGRLCIVPLQVGSDYTEEFDAGWVDAEGHKHLWGEGARFARQYDIDTLKSRILDNASGLSSTLLLLENAREIDPEGYLEYALMLDRTGED